LIGKNGILYSYPSLYQAMDNEILVIGGGITGSLISHALMEDGYKVMLIDKRDIAMGSISATTSMLQYEIDTLMYKLCEMIRETGAAECYQGGIDAILDLGVLVKSNKIDCGFKLQESLYIAHDRQSSIWLRKEFDIRDKYNLGLKWLDGAEVKRKFGVICHGAILSETAASVDAYKLAHKLIHRNKRKSIQVYDQTEIDRIETSGKRPKAFLKTGQTVTANHIICCTGFESTLLLKEKVVDLYYTYATVSEQGIKLNKHVQNTLIWDTGEPYTYMRSTDDGRFLVGGEDSSFNFQFFQQKTKERKADKLIKKFNHFLPEIEFIEDFSWAGTFGTTKDGLPTLE